MLAAVERGAPGVYNVGDDDPATVAEWLPTLAKAVGARPPRSVPAWLAKFLVGAAGVAVMTENRGISSVKAKLELGWKPTWSSWLEGFRRGWGSRVIRSLNDKGACTCGTFARCYLSAS